MFLTPSLRKKCLSMKKYNQLLNNSFSPKTTIYQNRLYLQQYDNIQPIIEDNFDDIIFIKKESTEKPNVKDESSKVSETTKEETTKETTKEETDEKKTTEEKTDDKKTTEEEITTKEITKEETTNEEEETSDNIPVLPATPSDNKKTIIISQKILDSANIKDNIFSDEEDNNDEELFGGKNNENSFF